jgi:hypothetical protein
MVNISTPVSPAPLGNYTLGFGLNVTAANAGLAYLRYRATYSSAQDLNRPQISNHTNTAYPSPRACRANFSILIPSSVDVVHFVSAQNAI